MAFFVQRMEKAKRYIVEIGTTPLNAVVSMTAARLCRSLSEVAGDVVLSVPVRRILEGPLMGLAVRRDEGKIIGANRVLLLVRGTSTTKMESILDDKALEDQIYKVSPTAADCLLSDPPAQVNSVGYCAFANMRTYRVDKESALILASAVQGLAPGSASAAGAAGDARPTATFDGVIKLSKDDVAVMTRSLADEWKAILTG